MAPESTPESPAPNTESLEDEMMRYGLVEQYLDLSEAFSATELGRGLAAVATLRHFIAAPKLPQHATYARCEAHVMSHRGEAFTEISQALDRLGPDQSPARRFLLQLGAGLANDHQARTAFLTREASRDTGNGVDAAVALETLIHGTNRDPRVIEPAFERIYAAHRGDKETERALLYAYALVSPERAEELRKEQKR